MIENCPHCLEKFEFSEAQVLKLQEALAGLPPEKRLTLNCPHCRRMIALDNGGNIDITVMSSEEGGEEAAVKPPSPPDIDRLGDDGLTDGDRIEDVPMALILHPSPLERRALARTLEQMGYRTSVSASAEDALEKMRFVNFACVVLHSRFEDGGLRKGLFHKTMRCMAMSRRRYIFYILVGPELHTLYDLQALALSANLTINDRDISRFGAILRKAIPAYEELFAPIMEEIGIYGRK